MKAYRDYVDLSEAFVTTTTTHDVVPAADANRLTYDVYDEFSGGASIHGHIIELAARLRPGVNGTPSNDSACLGTLRLFDYIHSSASFDRQQLRIKGIIAINMVMPEFFQGEVSAQLVEPFKNKIILPRLYTDWKSKSRIS